MRRTAEDAAATRVALLDAVLAVVARQGYAATRLEDVAAQAQVTRGALYHHFANKAELFNAGVAARWGELGGQLFGVLDGPGEPLARVGRFVSEYVRRIRTEPRFRELLEVVILRTEPHAELAGGLRDKQAAIDVWRAALVPILESAEAAGALRPGLDAGAAAADVVTMLHGVAVSAALSADAGVELLDGERTAATVVRGLAR